LRLAGQKNKFAKISPALPARGIQMVNLRRSLQDNQHKQLKRKDATPHPYASNNYQAVMLIFPVLSTR